MIDFSKLKIICGSRDGFVGIRKSDGESQNYEFCLPYGFDKFPIDDYDTIRDLFFKMYRAFKKFEKDSIETGRADVNDTEHQRHADQTTISDSGLSIVTKDSKKCLLYSKVRSIEKIIEAYNNLTLKSIRDRYKRKNKVDYSKLHEYLDRAIYLSDDTIYVEEMDMRTSVIHRGTTNLVGIYCYILHEVIVQLQGDVRDTVDRRAREISRIAERFSRSFLSPKQSLFDEDTYASTMSDLRNALTIIHKNTSYRGPDYWNLFEAVEAFLYGELDPDNEGGNFWGVKGFGHVWEDLCQTYFFDYFLDELGRDFSDEEGGLRICYADTDVKISGYENPSRSDEDMNRVGNYSLHDGSLDWHPWIYNTETSKSDANSSQWDKVFSIEFHRGTDRPPLRRFPRPDFVLRRPDGVQIYDFKCVGTEFFREVEGKLEHDLRKQLTYEYAAQQHFNITNNIFVIPKYERKGNKNLENVEKKKWDNLKGVEVFQIDFETVLECYINS
jgi:hypothetical protein